MLPYRTTIIVRLIAAIYPFDHDPQMNFLKPIKTPIHGQQFQGVSL